MNRARLVAEVVDPDVGPRIRRPDRGAGGSWRASTEPLSASNPTFVRGQTGPPSPSRRACGRSILPRRASSSPTVTRCRRGSRPGSGTSLRGDTAPRRRGCTRRTSRGATRSARSCATPGCSGSVVSRPPDAASNRRSSASRPASSRRDRRGSERVRSTTRDFPNRRRTATSGRDRRERARIQCSAIGLRCERALPTTVARRRRQRTRALQCPPSSPFGHPRLSPPSRLIVPIPLPIRNPSTRCTRPFRRRRRHRELRGGNDARCAWPHVSQNR